MCPTRDTLNAALGVCKAVLPAAMDGEDEVEKVTPQSGDDSAANSQQGAKEDNGASGLALKALRMLFDTTIFEKAVSKMQGRLSSFIAARDQAQITAELLQKAASGEARDHAS